MYNTGDFKGRFRFVHLDRKAQEPKKKEGTKSFILVEGLNKRERTQETRGIRGC